MNRDDVAQMMQDAAGADWGTEAHFQRFAALVAAAERTACARIASSYGGPKEPMMVGTYDAGWFNAAEAIAADIRARGEK